MSQNKYSSSVDAIIEGLRRRQEEAPAQEEPKGPTSEELLTEIRDLLKEKNQ